MKPSDFKHIVKESLREAFYTKKVILEGINGHKMTVNYYGETLPAVLSKNTKPTEKPYRISVFSDTQPRGHIELTQQEAEEILQNHKLPDDVIRIYGINLRLVKIDEDTIQEPLNEELYGKRMKMTYCGGDVDGVLSKNTKPDERPYRITWFEDASDVEEMEPQGHVDLTYDEVQFVLTNKTFPPEVYERLRINQKNITINYINENLLLLEDVLNESLTGQRLYIIVNMKRVPALISKNTLFDTNRFPHLGPIEKEKEYRITWFDNIHNLIPRGHHSFDKNAYDYIINNEDFPMEIKKYFSNKYLMPAGEICCKFVDKFDSSQLHESLLLLEESSREIDLWLENKNVIVETMNMVVAGANYKRTDRLDELVSYLDDSVLGPILRTINEPEKIDYFHKNSVGRWNMLSADGSYYEMQSGNPALGTINFYPAGIQPDMTRRILVGILKQLKILGIQWGQLKREKSGAYKISDVIRIPIIANNGKGYEGPEELNFSNVNAYQIFHNLLQFDGEHSFEMDAKELMERIETILKHDKSWIDKNVIKRTDSDWPKAERDTEEPVENPHLDIMNKITGDLGAGGARIIGMGLDAEGIEFRLQAIWKVAKWAVDHGHNKILVG